MKQFILSIIALLLFLAAAIFSAILLYDILTLPENPEGMGESIGKGLSIAISVIFFAIAAIVQGLSALLALIGLIVSKKNGAGGCLLALYAVQIFLPIVCAAVPFLLLPL